MTLAIAHRGARSIAPENTLAAARKAHELGADRWETDITVTSDGVLILFHDETLERTTDAAEIFGSSAGLHPSRFTLKELNRLSPGKRFLETDPFKTVKDGTISRVDLEAFKAERIPTLTQALELTRDLDWSVNVELKELPPLMNGFPMVREVIDAIMKSGIPLERVVISSFYHPWLNEIRSIKPSLELQALIGAWSDQFLDQEASGFHTINPDVSRMDNQQILRAKASGIRLNLYTVNRAPDMERLIRLNVDGIITDYPQVLVPMLRPPAR